MDGPTRNAVAAVIAALGGLAAIILITLIQPDRTPARLFPEAVEVRAFAWDFGFDGRKQVVPEGVVLNVDDIAKLRAAIFWTREPEWVASCCVPRHGFKFYDAKRQEIGSVEVCFECHCAGITGEKPSNSSHPWLDWDRKAVAEILAKQKLPVEL